MSAARVITKEQELTPGARAERAKRKVAEAIAELVAANIERAALAEADWIGPDQSPFTTFTKAKDGRRKRNARRHNALAKSGKLGAARKHGKDWLVRRDALNAYIEREGLARGRALEDDNVDDIVGQIERGGR